MMVGRSLMVLDMCLVMLDRPRLVVVDWPLVVLVMGWPIVVIVLGIVSGLEGLRLSVLWPVQVLVTKTNVIQNLIGGVQVMGREGVQGRRVAEDISRHAEGVLSFVQSQDPGAVGVRRRVPDVDGRTY